MTDLLREVSKTHLRQRHTGDNRQVALRSWLSNGTRDVHERLHHHPGFVAVADGSIDLESYRDLLGRLYGFYAALEPLAQLGTQRSRALADDLLATGATRADIAELPVCTFDLSLETPAARMGSRYVVEGAALGGQVLARAMGKLLGQHSPAGRSFFSGPGPGSGATDWHRFLHELGLSFSESDGPEMLMAARGVFEQLELGW